MDIEEARRIWNYTLTDEELEEWVRIVNTRVHEEDDPLLPSGCTINIRQE